VYHDDCPYDSATAIWRYDSIREPGKKVASFGQPTMLGVHYPKTMIEDNRPSCQLDLLLKLVHVLQVSETHIGNPRIIMTARILRPVPEHAAVQKLPSEALAVLQQNLGEIVEVSMLKSLRSFSIALQASSLSHQTTRSFHVAQRYDVCAWALRKDGCIAHTVRDSNTTGFHHAQTTCQS